MSSISIQKTSITGLKTDAIVNAANSGLWAGGGVCGAIFSAAGYDELQTACNKIGHCDTGSAVITPAFKLSAKFIIHAVGPQWIDGQHNEPRQLYSAYVKSLELAAENGCRSIGFPLISAGIFGYPLNGAWRKAIQACRDYLAAHTGVSMDVVFAVLDDDVIEAGKTALNENAPGLICWNDSKAKLHIKGQIVDAVFFHKPDEPDGYLSNWYPASFNIDGINFSSAEQYIMYQKCMIFGDADSAGAILATGNPQAQQDIGRNAQGYVGNVWSGIRQLVAVRGLTAKFSQNAELKAKLLSTGDAYLVECARSDTIWACGLLLEDDKRFDAEQWRGQNILGFALMEVRKALKG